MEKWQQEINEDIDTMKEQLTEIQAMVENLGDQLNRIEAKTMRLDDFVRANQVAIGKLEVKTTGISAMVSTVISALVAGVLTLIK